MFGAALARRSVLRATGMAPAFRASAPGLQLAQRRFAATTTPVTPEGAISILNSQRELRPSSPHFTIYQPQVTWLLSIANRVTGSFLSVGLYAFSITYLLHNQLPWLDSAHIVQFAHDLPTWLKGSAKLVFAVPFTFHTFNGIRHLLWDTGYGLTLKGVYAGGYAVMAATAAASAYLAFFV